MLTIKVPWSVTEQMIWKRNSWHNATKYFRRSFSDDSYFTPLDQSLFQGVICISFFPNQALTLESTIAILLFPLQEDNTVYSYSRSVSYLRLPLCTYHLFQSSTDSRIQAGFLFVNSETRFIGECSRSTHIKHYFRYSEYRASPCIPRGDLHVIPQPLNATPLPLFFLAASHAN